MRIKFLAMIGICLCVLALAGCDENPQVDAHIKEQQIAARKALTEIESLGAPKWVPAEYTAARDQYLDANQLVEEHQYEEAKKAMSLFYERVAIAKQDTLSAQKLAQDMAKQAQKPPVQSTSQPSPQPQLVPVVSVPPKLTPIPAAEEVVYYTVRPGDTLWKIISRPEFSTAIFDWDLIDQYNDGLATDPSKIRSGQVLIIIKQKTVSPVKTNIKQRR